MLYALDTEFMEDGHTIDLLSLALVSLDGRELYLQSNEADLHAANPWVQVHVIPCLDHPHCWKPYSRRCKEPLLGTCPWRSRDYIKQAVLFFVEQGPTPPSFVGYFSAYDWVALCQLWGPMVDLHHNWPMYCHDLRAMLDWQGLQALKQPDDMPHHALSDARWIMETYKRYCYHAGQGQ